MKNLILIHFLLLNILGCRSGADNQETLNKAHQVHLEAIAIKKTVDSILIYKGGKSIDMAIADSINVLATEWERGLIEVPGFEESEHNHSHHDHNNTKTSMQANDLLSYQIISKNAIQEILIDLEKLNSK